MAFAPISFDVQRKNASAQSVQAYHKQAVNFEDLLTPEQKLKILERDKYSCQCCGFRSEKYQKIHAKNGNQNDHASDNLMTLCIFLSSMFPFRCCGDNEIRRINMAARSITSSA